MSTVATTYQYLERDPKSSLAQLSVKGRRIRARTLYGAYACLEPRTPEEIAADYDVPLEAVKEAIAYCESNPPELLEDYAREERLMEATGMNHPDYKYHAQPKSLTAEERARVEHG